MGLQKPDSCNLCRLAQGDASSGFCPDSDLPPWQEIKLALLLPYPSKDAALHGDPLDGGTGYWIEKNLLEPVGVKKEETLVCHLVRCHVKRQKTKNTRDGDPLENILTPSTLDFAKQYCRTYDAALRQYNPNVAFCCAELSSFHRVPPLVKICREAVFRRAVEMWRRGYKPLIAFGSPAVQTVMPWVTSVKPFLGHYIFLNGGWPL